MRPWRTVIGRSFTAGNSRVDWIESYGSRDPSVQHLRQSARRNGTPSTPQSNTNRSARSPRKSTNPSATSTGPISPGGRLRAISRLLQVPDNHFGREICGVDPCRTQPRGQGPTLIQPSHRSDLITRIGWTNHLGTQAELMIATGAERIGRHRTGRPASLLVKSLSLFSVRLYCSSAPAMQAT